MPQNESQSDIQNDSTLAGSQLEPESHPFARISTTARLTPEKIAIISDGKETSYGALEAQSTLIAAALRQRGIGEGDIIGIMMERGADIVISILAIWKAGAAYLPLDPDYPEERLAYMARDSQAICILSKSTLGPDLESTAQRLNIDEAWAEGCQDTSVADPDTSIAEEIAPPPSRRAYVIYTSGSTGQPKGVENTHGALSNFLQSMILEPGIGGDDVLLSVTTMSFDISILEYFIPLLVGARLIIATQEEGIDGFDLIDLIDDHAVTIMQGTPSTWRMITSCDWPGRKRLRALCGGEALPPALATALFEKTAGLWNMYGPTETTVWSTCDRVDNPKDISIGTPVHNTDIYILDGEMNVVPQGTEGDLWIGGAGVATGYLNRPALTGERFRPNPFKAGDGRIYMTGDLARIRPDGKIRLSGRRDSQLKIRGYRIEPEEIENALEQHPGISQAAIALRDANSTEAVLAAYIVRAGDTASLDSEFRLFLRNQIPDYMIPQVFMEVEALPLTNNNKVDRRKLPQLTEGKKTESRVTHPGTEREAQIMEAWQEVLGIADISVTDNFFDLGGQSLQVVEMSALLHARHGFRLAPRAVIFETLEQLAASSSQPPGQKP